ncbi:molybdopterin molybdotransferase MoeA [Intrasporangium sp.]|uniref:molybdopterin molybdotransferase MoeA n=1 Tax=Intrasporangium sp. TaxID=1925024 RepID=UPI003221BCB3
MRTAAEHLEAILTAITPAPRERVALAEAVGLALAEDVTATADLPGFDNSAMDGYAVQAGSLAGADAQPVRLRIVGEVAAGAFGRFEVGAGEAARIMTGAPVPAGADAVIPVEQTDAAAEGAVTCRAPVDPGQFVRRRGEDVRAGTVVARAGQVVGPRTVALIAASGHADCLVHRRPHVVVVSTGDELVPPGQPLGPGQIHDSNSVMLQAAVVAAGATAEIRAAVADSERDLLLVLDEAIGPMETVETTDPVGRADAARQAGTARRNGTGRRARAGLADEPVGRADVIVTSGGVSMGAYDVVKSGLRGSGVEFVTVAMQPGKPQGFGFVLGTSGRRVPLFALPGNPVSSYVSFELFVRPALRRMMGRVPESRPTRRARVTQPLRSPAGRRQFARAVVDHDAAGELLAEPVAGQGSHFVADLSRANALLVVPETVTQVAAGAELDVILLDVEGES